MNSSDYQLPAKNASRKTGEEPLHSGDSVLGPTLVDFWQWSSSNLLDNTQRGTVAEWLVAIALNCAAGVRTEWGGYDLTTPTGLKIEVKSAAYLQSWAQERYSTISFSIRQAHAWDPETNTRSSESKRTADVYVFCLLAHKDKETVDPLDVSQWRFFIASSAFLNEAFSDQRSLGLSRLVEMGLRPIGYVDLPTEIETVAEQIHFHQ